MAHEDFPQQTLENPYTTHLETAQLQEQSFLQRVHEAGSRAVEFAQDRFEGIKHTLPVYAATGTLALGGAYESGIATAASQPARAASRGTDNTATPWKVCPRKYNSRNDMTWICAKVTGVHEASGAEPVAYTYDFKARHTLRGLRLCFGGMFKEANKDDCLWQHKYRVFEKGREVKKTLHGTPEFKDWGATVGILARSRNPEAGWRVIGTLKQQANTTTTPVN